MYVIILWYTKAAGIPPSKVRFLLPPKRRNTPPLRNGRNTAITGIMITLAEEKNKSISQVIYDEALKKVYFFSLQCPACGHRGCLSGHGHYFKKVMTESGKIHLKMQRVICTCGVTHVIFLASMVPGSSFPAEVHREIAENGSGNDTILRLQLRFPDISQASIRYVFRQFRHHWEQKLLSFSISLKCLGLLVQQCFSCCSRQFMQIKCWPNALFVQPT